MNTLEKYLEALNSKNLKEIVHKIKRRIDYCIHNKIEAEFEAVSLIPVVDLLAEDYSPVTLRKMGFIVNIEQLEQDTTQYMKRAKEDSISNNRYLKRLFRNAQVLKRNYIANNIHNKAVKNSIKENFTQNLLGNFVHGSFVQMPEEMSQWVEKQAQKVVKVINKVWYQNKQEVPLNRKFSGVFVENIVKDWQQGNLEKNVIAKLMEEKEKANSSAALITYFKKKSLPEDIQKKVNETCIIEIYKDLKARKLSPAIGLGASIKGIKKESFLNKKEAILEVVQNWQSEQVDNNTAEDIEVYLKKTINELRAPRGASRVCEKQSQH